MSPCFLGVTVMQHGNVSNIASFSKKNDDLRYVSLTWNLKVGRAVYYKQGRAICMAKKALRQRKQTHFPHRKIYIVCSNHLLDGGIANASFTPKIVSEAFVFAFFCLSAGEILELTHLHVLK